MCHISMQVQSKFYMYVFIFVCLYIFFLCMLLSSFGFVSMEFHNYDPPIVMHISFFLFSHDYGKFPVCLECTWPYLCTNKFGIFCGSMFLIALCIDKPVLYFNKSSSFNAFNFILIIMCAENSTYCYFLHYLN